MGNSTDFNLSHSVGKGRTNILPLLVNDVSYEINGMRLIKELNIKFSSNGLSLILGPNGAGKSLLLRLCHGLIEPSSGTINWGGPDGSLAKACQAMVFQRPIMLRRSVFANMDHSLKCRGFKKSKRTNKIEEVLKLTGLARLANVSARRLSVGEQQRLAIARAWCLEPQVLFLDEPTAALDPAATHSLEGIIEIIKKSGTKIIMTTHDLGQAKRLADEVLFLYRGRLLERATARQFFEKPENDLAQSFIRGELLWWNRKELKPSRKFNLSDEN